MALLLDLKVKLTLTCLLCWIAHRLLRAAIDPLRSVPGTFLAKLTRLWYLKAVNKGDFELQNIQLHREHGRCQF